MSQENEIIKNKELVKKYPFLYPHDWSGKIIEDYDYSYTELDAMPSGWKKAWGELFCEDLAAELSKFNFLNKYFVVEVKEKYGSLRWYDNGYPIGSKIPEIISKYEHVSERTCICCGAFPVPITEVGLIEPMCKTCFDKRLNVKGDYESFIVDNSPYDKNVVISCYSKEKGKTTKIYDTTDIINRMNK